LDSLETAVTNYYLTSGDFNGLHARLCIPEHADSLESLKAALIPLIESGRLAANFGTVHANPHIRAFLDLPPAEQVKLLSDATTFNFVLYPTPAVLKEQVDPADYAGRPFSLRLALGDPQLSYVSFDLAILDHYRRDPRYRFWTDDVQATLSIGDESYTSVNFPEKHKILIQHFGFSFAEDDTRAVAVFLTDLDGLTAEHQQLWNAMALEGEYKLHPDYYRAAIEGDWGLRISLREAFMAELRTINAMCTAIGWKPLFREIPEETPQGLSFLLRPTRHEFGEFLMTADKLLSDNINKDFFPPDIARDTRQPQDDGSIEVKAKGTIALLEEWVATKFRLRDDPKVLEDLFRGLREVRKLRQLPAHSLKPNEYDPTLFEEQRQLFQRAYSSLRTLRMILANHPMAGPAEAGLDSRVYKGEIWSH
jgi:hypothetical protein